jgi:hypothetical protein
MTSVSLKLVGNYNEIIINYEKNEITILDIFNYLLRNDLSFNEISKITFIHNGKNITDDTCAKYKGTDDEPFILHMYTNNSDVKIEILKNIYNQDKLDEIELLDNISNTNDDNHDDNNHSNDSIEDNITLEEINKQNEEVIKLFSDKDFTYLLKICLEKPELVNTVTSYITNGNITFQIKTSEQDKEFNYPNEYIKILELLNQLNINITNEDNIKSIIQHFEGHLNLSLRYILNNHSDKV